MLVDETNKTLSIFREAGIGRSFSFTKHPNPRNLTERKFDSFLMYEVELDPVTLRIRRTNEKDFECTVNTHEKYLTVVTTDGDIFEILNSNFQPYEIGKEPDLSHLIHSGRDFQLLLREKEILQDESGYIFTRARDHELVTVHKQVAFSCGDKNGVGQGKSMIDGCQLDHSDNWDKSNCSVDNIEWVPREVNGIKALKAGRDKDGTRRIYTYGGLQAIAQFAYYELNKKYPEGLLSEFENFFQWIFQPKNKTPQEKIAQVSSFYEILFEYAKKGGYYDKEKGKDKDEE